MCRLHLSKYLPEVNFIPYPNLFDQLQNHSIITWLSIQYGSGGERKKGKLLVFDVLNSLKKACINCLELAQNERNKLIIDFQRPFQQNKD